jgi:methionine-rich copper-binding protein CopC
MKQYTKAMVATSLLVPGLALAHAHLLKATPAEGAELVVAPKAVQLQFSEAAQLTAASLQAEGGAKQDLPHEAAPAATQVELPLPALAAGHYALAWRVLSADGHVMSGTLHFAVGAPR